MGQNRQSWHCHIRAMSKRTRVKAGTCKDNNYNNDSETKSAPVALRQKREDALEEGKTI